MVKITMNIIGPYDNAPVFVVACNISCLFKGSIQCLILSKAKQEGNCAICTFCQPSLPSVFSIFSSSSDLARKIFLCANYFFQSSLKRDQINMGFPGFLSFFGFDSIQY